jgi:hypothetical protein
VNGPASALAEVLVGARFLAGLPLFLRRPVDLAEARRIVAARLQDRGGAFLRLAERAIYGQPASPYRTLLAAAGCEYGDLVDLVRREGLEGALRHLLSQGVYLSADEFKGRRPASRGPITALANSAVLRNPDAVLRVPGRTSGSRGQGVPLLFDFAFVRDCAADYLLALHARGGRAWDKAIWSVPGGGALFRIMKLAALGSPPVRWFSQVDPGDPGLHGRYRWSAHALRWAGTLGRVALPHPEHVPLDDPLPIVRWMAITLRAGRTPYLRSFASSVVRVCQAAAAAGIDLEGAEFTMAGEPVTPARLAVVRSVGATARPRYGCMETGPVGYGCLAPAAPDDVHVVSDLHAVIQADGAVDGTITPGTLFLTGLCSTAPFVLLNVSLGDQAVSTEHACGCPLEALGWVTHLHTIRSSEKLTGEGMTFLDADVIRLLEETLPARFGGAPTDYQVVEEHDVSARTRLRLLVHPSVGPLDADQVRQVFLEGLSAGSGANRVMGRVWQDARLIEVERRPPMATGSGKVLHFHVSPLT